MKLQATTGREDIAVVYIADMGGGRRIEFVESVQPPIPRERKWVLIVSTLYGCTVRCRFCDAGSHYRGKLSTRDMIAQVDYMVQRRYPDRKVPAGKFKVQFARMGEPAFNENVIDAMAELPKRYEAPGLMPAVSTIAPAGCGRFFDRLLETKNELFGGRFQLQFSIHTTDPDLRDWLVPASKWSFERIASYGERFFEPGDRKVALNFALAEGMPVDTGALLRHFSPGVFLVKLTPVNPTFQAQRNRVVSHIRPDEERYDIADSLRAAGYDVILSIGELEENHIGSNCGQYVTEYGRSRITVEDGYSYELLET
jgi:23S rRNA (adenine2503-C2)-methyltransferase